MDFTLVEYRKLLTILQQAGYSFQPYADFLSTPAEKVVILRHDVDKRPRFSLITAQIEQQLGISGTYYFRAVPCSFNPQIIKEIHHLGHEIGYHYEDLSLVAKSHQTQKTVHKTLHAMSEKAILSFESNLESLRKLTPITTICMHGSPLSKWDSRLLWKYYNYRASGIKAEPYFDIDFSGMLYLTDTGRRWNGAKFSLRDKGLGTSSNRSARIGADNMLYRGWKKVPVRGSLMEMTTEGIDFQGRYSYRSTGEIIRAVEEGRFPEKAMITFHPQRWTDKPIPWVGELVWQNTKNIVKYFLIRKNNWGRGYG